MLGDLFGMTIGGAFTPQQQRTLSAAEIAAAMQARANAARQVRENSSVANQTRDSSAVSFVKRDGVWELPR